MPPISSQTINSQTGEPSDLAIPAGVRKIPTAMTSPTIRAVAVPRPICRFSSTDLLNGGNQVSQRQVIVWDRGRPARSAPQARSLSEVALQPIFALRAHLR